MRGEPGVWMHTQQSHNPSKTLTATLATLHNPHSHSHKPSQLSQTLTTLNSSHSLSHMPSQPSQAISHQVHRGKGVGEVVGESEGAAVGGGEGGGDGGGEGGGKGRGCESDGKGRCQILEEEKTL